MYYYLNHSHQPMQVRFDIRKARVFKTIHAGSPDARPTYDSTVEVTITIAGVSSGRMATGIKTFQSIWQGRKSVRVSSASKSLINELSQFQALLEAAHAELLSQGKEITGRAVLQTIASSGNLKIPLLRVYEEFCAARKASIEPDRRKRKEDQISIATYSTYGKRWDMILLYLNANKWAATKPIGGIDYGFATGLKEFLTAYKPKGVRHYSSATINKCMSLLKMLVTYAQKKGYVRENPISNFACRGGSAANPKPLSEAMLVYLESCELPPTLRHICDSWLVAAELCLHYSDYMNLPNMSFVEHQNRLYVQNERSKQQGTSLVQTVNVTARAKRILDKYSGPQGLYYRSSGAFSSGLKQIVFRANLTDAEGNFVNLSFGMGRDSGLTDRARKGANGIQLTSMAGWSNPREARRYLGDALGIVSGFVDRSEPTVLENT